MSLPKVLVVDDDPQGVMAIMAALDGMDTTFVTAGSGEEALRILLGEDTFAVILLDVLMPGLDGMETATLIRERERYRYTPIIFLTGVSLESRYQRLAYEAGAVDYMFKPIEPWVLRSKVEVFVSLARNTALVSELARSQAALLEDLAAKNRQLEAESRYKTTFLSMVSHELRTPLNAVLGFARALHLGYMGPISPGQVEAVEAIASSGSHLLALINDILDLTRIEAGMLQLKCEDVRLGRVVDDAFLVLERLAAERSIRLERHYPEPVSWVHGDAVRLKQILLNLLANGIKFTQPGGYVRLTLSADGPDLIMQVEDNGPGIDAEQQHLLFLPFQQLGDYRPESDGSGLGLALTKHLVEAHHGTIEVCSARGRGATFTVRLPGAVRPDALGDAPAEPGAAPVGGYPSGERIAVVDDNAQNRLLLTVLLARQGYEVLEAGSVEEGIALIVDRRPALAFVDILMPDGGGPRVLQEVRARSHPRIPLVAISAGAMKGDRERMLEIGFDAFVAKPIEFDEVVQITRALKKR